MTKTELIAVGKGIGVFSHLEGSAAQNDSARVADRLPEGLRLVHRLEVRVERFDAAVAVVDEPSSDIVIPTITLLMT
ncbi:MAG: hypothetical protein GEU75_05155 [Dehalococcoidia bacterium]|nr:hypothetical protein [Dehalococcoidia bacterium]